MRIWLFIGVGAVALFAACESTPSTAGPKPKPSSAQSSTAVDRARKQLADLNATQIALKAAYIEQRNLLLSMPQDSPPTREITRQLAIINSKAQPLLGQVFIAELALERAIEVEKNAALNTATNSIPTTVDTNTPPATATPVAEKGALKLQSFKLDSSSGAGTKFVIGELENSGSAAADNVTVIFELFDAADGSLGTVSDFIAQIAPGAKWSFKALVPDDAAVRVEFMDISTGAPSGLPALPGTGPVPKPVTPPPTPPTIPTVPPTIPTVPPPIP
jgi:hypothetical protein